MGWTGGRNDSPSQMKTVFLTDKKTSLTMRMGDIASHGRKGKEKQSNHHV